jgi:hypothetical protein
MAGWTSIVLIAAFHKKTEAELFSFVSSIITC